MQNWTFFGPFLRSINTTGDCSLVIPKPPSQPQDISLVLSDCPATSFHLIHRHDPQMHSQEVLPNKTFLLEMQIVTRSLFFHLVLVNLDL